MKKVLLTGTFRSGKSTLLQELKVKKGFEDCKFIEEIARPLLEANPLLEQNPKFQDILFAEQVNQEQQNWIASGDWLICDRGSLDILAYSTYFGHAVKQEWIDWTRTYDKVFLTNMRDIPFTAAIIEAESQYVAGRDWIQFRADMEQIIIDQLQTLGIEYILLSGSVQDRSLFLSRELHLLPRTIEGSPRYSKERI